MGADEECVDNIEQADSESNFAGGEMPEVPVDNSSGEGVPGRTSISSDDSTCSLLSPENTQFYYFYQGKDIHWG